MDRPLIWNQRHWMEFYNSHWQYRGLAAVRMFYLMFVGLVGLMLLLVRSSASKDPSTQECGIPLPHVA
jgi:hypothetical protein